MDRCIFALYDSRKSRIAAKFVLGNSADFLMEHFIFPVYKSAEDDLFTNLFDSRKGLWIQNTKITPYSKEIMYKLRTTLNVESFFISPIIVNRRPIGVFYADRQPSKRALDEDSFANFELLSHQAGISIEVTVHLGTKFTITFSPVSVYQCLRFVRLGLRSILVLFEKAQTGEDEVLVNAYQ